MIFTVALTWCGRPSGYRSSTSACRCTVDHDGTSSMSASASRITSGAASNITSRDALTAMRANTNEYSGLAQDFLQLISSERSIMVWHGPHQPISSTGVVPFGGEPIGADGVRENRGAGAA